MKKIIKKNRVIISFLCITLLFALFTISFTACNKRNKDADYYLSLASEQWQTYDKNESIPEKVHFKKAGDNLYNLEITLEKGEQFTVNQVGSSEKVGFDKVFSAGDDLTRGDNGNIKVAHSGTYVFSYDKNEEILNYTYTARRVAVEITTDVTTLYVGDHYTYKAAAVYSNGDAIEEQAEWTSGDEGVLTVGANGEVTAVSAGSATLTATIEGLSDEIEITVEQGSVAVTGVKLTQTKLSMELNAEEQLEATVLPENADSKLVSWRSENDSIATVTQQGVVKAVGYGSTNIIVSTAQGGYEARCAVTVVKHVSAMRFDRESVSLAVNGEINIGLIFSPSDASFKDCDIEVSAGNAVSVEKNGEDAITVKGLAEGSAVIKATLKENREITATCNVTVLAEGMPFVSMKQDATIILGGSTNLTVELDNAEIKSVDWSVAEEDVATCVGDGANATVTGVNFGATTVTATVTDINDKKYTATCNVLVSAEYFFIYGYGLGATDWDYTDYVADINAARKNNLLFEETDRGVYKLTRYLTPDNGFQIIFPNVAQFTRHDDNSDKDIWDKNIPSQWIPSSSYFASSSSNTAYITNANDYFCVNTPGVYIVTLNLTQGSMTPETFCRVSINMVSLDISSVELTLSEGNCTLKSGETAVFDFAISPSAADFTEEQLEIALASTFADYADFLKYALDFGNRKITVTVNGAIPEQFVATLQLSVRGVTTSIDLYILSDADAEVKVSSVEFAEKHYYVNVNQGGATSAWQQIVEAKVNADATNQQVRYYDITDYSKIREHGTSIRATVDAMTGLVTGKVLGTVTIQAVSVADESKTDTCLVTFYSDQIYYLGESYGGWTPLDSSYSSVEGTAFANQVFTMLSQTHFRLTIQGVINGQFEIAFLGMDSKWAGSINYRNLVKAMSNTVEGWSYDYSQSQGGNSVMLHNTKQFTIDLDLSRHQAFFTLNTADGEFEGFELGYDENHTDLKKGESVNVELYLIPNEVDEKDINYSLSDDGEYVDAQYDETNRVLKLNVVQTEHAEDKQITLTVKVKNKTLTATFTILAEHHLELTWDDTDHWYRCTDDGCNYYEDSEGVANQKTAHHQESSLTGNAEGHYYACSGCGKEFGLVPHEYELNNGVFDFSANECSVCHFKLFEIEGNTLKAYYGSAESVKVPNNVTVLGAHVFEGHTEIKTLTYSDQLTTIEDYAFAGCKNLQKVYIGNRVAKIGRYAFNGIGATVEWGNSTELQELGTDAFHGYLGTALTIPSSVRTVQAGCFAFSNLISMEIPDTVAIWYGSNAFKGCTSLRSVVLGKNVDQISVGMFSGCTSLRTVLVKGTIFWCFAADCFEGCDALQAVYICRPLDEILTCDWLVMPSLTRGILKGKVYVYSEENPGSDPCGDRYTDTTGYFRDYIAGTWHWDDSEWKTIAHIKIWDEEQTTSVENQPAIIDDRKDYYVI